MDGNAVLHTTIIMILSTFCEKIKTSPLMGNNVKPAETMEFPFVVSLSFSKQSRGKLRYLYHFCGGSLITDKHVITAAHCIENKQPLEVLVMVGSVDLNEGKMHTIRSWITYNEWARENNMLTEFPLNDIAVIVLSMRVADIVPAVRSKLSDVDIFNKNVVTAGWGRIADNSKTQFLHKGYLRVLTPQLCERNVLKLFGSEDEMEDSMPENHYCTSAEPPLILGCGDSGSPLLLEDTKEIIGINEATCEVEHALTHPFATNIHVKVNYFNHFIDIASM